MSAARSLLAAGPPSLWGRVCPGRVVGSGDLDASTPTMPREVADSGLFALSDAKAAECEQRVREKVDAWKAGEGTESAVEMVAKINAYRATFAETYGKPIPPATVEKAIRLHGHRGLHAMHIAAEWTLRPVRSVPRSCARPSRRRTVRRRQTSRTARAGPSRSTGAGDSDPPPHPELDHAAAIEAVVQRSRQIAAECDMAWIGDLVFAELDRTRRRAA